MLKPWLRDADDLLVRHEGSRAISRRAVSWDPGVGVLTVGERSVTLTCAPGDNECVLRTYLHLVAEQRDVPLGRSVVLRRDDVLVLAELLDLDDVRLEKQLGAILRLSDPEAKALRRDLLRQRVTAAALGVGMVAGVPLATVAAADPGDPGSRPAATTAPVEPDVKGSLQWTAVPTTAAVTVEAPAEEPAVEVAPAPAPVAAAAAAEVPEQADPPPWTPPADDGVEIGYSVTYERDPDFVPPEGVEIGDAMVIERDLPPAPPGHQPDAGEPGPPDHAEATPPADG